ncbi:hypothetical protein TNCV_2543841 [Trichonephila clavipes]|nr:hypothetical protein TNCV_2543841 [Trichonephila clavipes]
MDQSSLWHVVEVMRGGPAQVLFSLLNHGSKFRGPSSKIIKTHMTFGSISPNSHNSLSFVTLVAVAYFPKGRKESCQSLRQFGLPDDRWRHHLSPPPQFRSRWLLELTDKKNSIYDILDLGLKFDRENAMANALWVSVRSNISKRWNTTKNDVSKNQSSADSALRLPNTEHPSSVLALPFLVPDGFSLRSLTLLTFLFVFAHWRVFPLSTTYGLAVSW